MTQKIYRSQFAKSVLVLKGKPFTFEYHAPFEEIYDWPRRNILFKTARQVGKSTFFASEAVTDCMLEANKRIFYASTSERQAREFARVKLNEFLARSPRVRKYLMNKKYYDIQDSIFDKSFTNGSGITISYMKGDADRTRGFSADKLMLDEIQDMDPSEIPVVQEVLSASLNPSKMFAGTPKTLDNPIEVMWQKSTKHEIFFRCKSCGVWNDIGYKNIGKRGPICARCGGDLDMQRFEIVATGDVDKAVYLAVRIPQPALRLHYGFEQKWKDLLEKYETYDESRFHNEVLGISYSKGARFLTEEDIVSCCVPSLDLVYPPVPEKLRNFGIIVAGIDWSGGGIDNMSKTVLTIYGEMKGDRYDGIGGRLQLLYYKIFPQQDYMQTIREIVNTVVRYSVVLIGADAGEGALNNSYIADSLGHHRIQPFRYGMYTPPVKLSKDRMTIYLDKTTAIDDFFKALKPKPGDSASCGKFIFPNAKVMREPILHLLSEHEHTTQAGNRVWMRGAHPDDFLHSSVFAYNAYKKVKGVMKFY